MALDCAKATTPIDNAICGDPAAADADDNMTKAYDALAARLAEAGQGRAAQLRKGDG